MCGNHLLKSWSLTQRVISLSSGEAEYYAIVKGASVGLGLKAMLSELNVDTDLTLKTDASAAVGISMRRGLGKVRHIDVTQLWVQEKIAQKVFRICKVNTTENLSDALTKGISQDEMDWHLRKTGQVRMESK